MTLEFLNQVHEITEQFFQLPLEEQEILQRKKPCFPKLSVGSNFGRKIQKFFSTVAFHLLNVAQMIYEYKIVTYQLNKKNQTNNNKNLAYIKNKHNRKNKIQTNVTRK